MRACFVTALLLAAGIATSLLADAPKDRLKVEVRRAETEKAEGLTEAKVGDGERKVYLHKEVELTVDDIQEAKATSSKDDPSIPILELILTEAGGKKMAKVSEAHHGKPLAVLIDGKVIFAPTVREKISDKVQITGAFTATEAERLAKRINGN